jgi:hypothetical protein
VNRSDPLNTKENVYLFPRKSPSTQLAGPRKMSLRVARHVFSATARSSVRLRVNEGSIRMGTKRLNSSHAPKQSSDSPWIVCGFSCKIVLIPKAYYWCTVSYRLFLL